MQGERNPHDDSEWNDFTKTLTSLSRAKMMKIAQDAYTRKAEREAEATK